MKYSFAICLSLFFLLLSSPGEGSVICNQTYALCDTSPCIAIPGVKDKAICTCSVFNGPSLGNLSCQERKPIMTKHKEMLLKSNYSFANTSIHKVMTCPAGARWTFCLDKPCIEDPRNPNIAICTCDIKYTEAFVTFGGNCDTSTCSNTLYSGATLPVMEGGNVDLIKFLNLTKAPTIFCPKPK